MSARGHRYVVGLCIASIGLCVGASSGSSSSSGSAHGSSGIDLTEARQDCRLLTRQAFLDKYCDDTVGADIACSVDVDSTAFVEYADYRCHKVCPIFGHGDLKCSDESHHSISYEGWERNMMWSIAFLSCALLVGATGSVLLRKYAPFIPYTVGLLLVGIVLGALAHTLSSQEDCPHLALDPAFDQDHSGTISRSEWEYFACADCEADSVCRHPGSRRAPTGDLTFEKIDGPFRFTPFDPAPATIGTGNSSSITAFDHMADGMLYPDELWSGKCNFFSSLISLSNMDPHLLLVVFLPPLLFESAYAMDEAIFNTQLNQILILAIPGVVISSLLTACIIWALYSNWASFEFAWLTGTILSATDPVAVVALLKELGAAKALGTLIEGESLLNDGSSVVLFTFIYNLIKTGGDYHTLPFTANGYIEVLRIVAQMLLLGPLYGWLAGRLVCKFLRYIYNDMVVEVAIIVSSIYFVFWSSEVVLKSAAVLSVVTMGYVINQERLCISVQVHEFLHHFFEMVAWMLNTVIFLICGAKLGEVIAKWPVQSSHILDYDGMVLLDLPKSFAVYAGVNVVRLVTVTIFFLPLSRLGTGFDWRTGAVVVWGGLRGSVGLALALVVLHSQYATFWGGSQEEPATFADYRDARVDLPCRDVPVKILMLASWIVLFTVVINGSLMAKLIEILKLDALSDDRKFMLDRAMKRLHTETNVVIAGLQHNFTDGQVDWKTVRERYSYVLDIHVNYDLADESEAAAAQMQALNIEGASYLEQHERGEISDKAAAHLQMHMTRLQARVERGGDEGGSAALADKSRAAYDEEMRDLGRVFEVTSWKVALRSMRLTRAWAERAIFEELSLAYEVGKAYIKAAESVKKLYNAQHAQNVHHAPSFTTLHSSVESSLSLGSGIDPSELEGSASVPPSPPMTPQPPEVEKHDVPIIVQRETTRSTTSSDAGGRDGGGRDAGGRNGGGGGKAAGLASSAKGMAAYTAGMAKGLAKEAAKKVVAFGPASAPPRLSSSASVHLNALEEIVDSRERYALKMKQRVNDLQESYPDVLRAVETRFAATIVLRRQARMVEKMKEHGELSEMDAATLIDDINKQRKHLFFLRSHELGNKNDEDTLLDVPAFSFLKGEAALRERATKDLHGQKWQSDCSRILTELVRELAQQAYNTDDIVLSPSLIRDPERERGTSVDGAPGASGGGNPQQMHPSGQPASSRRRRRSVADIMVGAAVGIAHKAEDMVSHVGHTGRSTSTRRKTECRGTDSSYSGGSSARATDGSMQADASPKASRKARGSPRASITAGIVAITRGKSDPAKERDEHSSSSDGSLGVGGGGGGTTKRGNRGSVLGAVGAMGGDLLGGGFFGGRDSRERAACVADTYDRLILVKRGQLCFAGESDAARGSMVQSGPPDVDGGSRKLGPCGVTGVACVLQQVDLERMDRDNLLPPSIWCTRPAETLALSGRVLREAIRSGGMAGEDLRKELWCLHAKELATRSLRIRPPWSGWSDEQLGEYVERAVLLEWDDAHPHVEVEMQHYALLVCGACMIDTNSFRHLRGDGGGGGELYEPSYSGRWVQAPKVLRPGERVRIHQHDPLDPSPPPQRSSSTSSSTALRRPPNASSSSSSGPPPLAQLASGSTEPRLKGHKDIRMLVLLEKGEALKMEAPLKMPIAVDVAERQYGQGLTPRRDSSITRAGDLRKSLKRNSSIRFKGGIVATIDEADAAAGGGSHPPRRGLLGGRSFKNVVSAAQMSKAGKAQEADIEAGGAQTADSNDADGGGGRPSPLLKKKSSGREMWNKLALVSISDVASAPPVRDFANPTRMLLHESSHHEPAILEEASVDARWATSNRADESGGAPAAAPAAAASSTTSAALDVASASADPSEVAVATD